MASAANRPATVEVGERDVAGRQQPGVDRAELDHAPVVGPGRADGELEVAGVLPVAQAAVVERVEDELAGEAEQVERPRSVLGDERARGGEVLAVHDLGRPRSRGTRPGVARRAGGRTRRRGRAVARRDHRSGAARCRRGSAAAAMRSRIAGSAWSRSQFGGSMMWASASWTTSPVELYAIARLCHRPLGAILPSAVWAGSFQPSRTICAQIRLARRPLSCDVQ